jgi:hypothetical protein
MDMQVAQQKAQLEMQKLQMEMQKMQAEMQIAMQELGIKRQAAEIDAHMQERKAATEWLTKRGANSPGKLRHEAGDGADHFQVNSGDVRLGTIYKTSGNPSGNQWFWGQWRPERPWPVQRLRPNARGCQGRNFAASWGAWLKVNEDTPTAQLKVSDSARSPQPLKLSPRLGAAGPRRA